MGKKGKKKERKARTHAQIYLALSVDMCRRTGTRASPSKLETALRFVRLRGYSERAPDDIGEEKGAPQLSAITIHYTVGQYCASHPVSLVRPIVWSVAAAAAVSTEIYRLARISSPRRKK